MSNTLALGRQPIDLSVYAKVAAHEAKLQDGVVRMDCGAGVRLPLCPRCGVKTRLDGDGNLHIDVNLIVRYGTDVRILGANVQEAVKSGVGRICDRPIACVNVNITGFELARCGRRLYERDATA